MAEPPVAAAGSDGSDDDPVDLADLADLADLEKVAAVDAIAQKAGVRFEDLIEALLLAEFETGREEESVEQAKVHLLVRAARITGGTLLVLVGLAGFLLPVLPGWILLFVGLGLLAQDVPFARRLLDRVKHRMPQDESGKIPRSTIIVMVLFGVLFLVGSIGFAIWRQSNQP